MDKYEGFSLALAIYDYLPILLSATGLILLVRYLNTGGRGRDLVSLAAFLVILGGLCKASWKLGLALVGEDYAALNNMLFLSMTPGFLCLAWVLMPRLKIAALILALVLAMSGAAMFASLDPGSRSWLLYLIAWTTLANTTVLILLIRESLNTSQKKAALFFGINLVGIYVMAGLGRIEAQTASLQWVEQSLNSLVQGSFALACYLLYRSGVSDGDALPSEQGTRS